MELVMAREHSEDKPKIYEVREFRCFYEYIYIVYMSKITFTENPK